MDLTKSRGSNVNRAGLSSGRFYNWQFTILSMESFVQWYLSSVRIIFSFIKSKVTKQSLQNQCITFGKRYV